MQSLFKLWYISAYFRLYKRFTCIQQRYLTRLIPKVKSWAVSKEQETRLKKTPTPVNNWSPQNIQISSGSFFCAAVFVESGLFLFFLGYNFSAMCFFFLLRQQLLQISLTSSLLTWYLIHSTAIYVFSISFYVLFLLFLVLLTMDDQRRWNPEVSALSLAWPSCCRGKKMSS